MVIRWLFIDVLDIPPIQLSHGTFEGCLALNPFNHYGSAS